MAARRTLLFLLLFATSAATGAAQEDGDTHRVALSAHNVGDQFWFMESGMQGERNPIVHLPPGKEVELVLENMGTRQHNVYIIHPVDQRLELIEPGRNGSFRFTVPADASGEAAYWCDPHQRFGMQGTVRFAAPEEGGLPALHPLVLVLVLVGIGAWVRGGGRERPPAA